MTRLQEHKEWATNLAKKTRHDIEFPRAFQLSKKNYRGYVAPCQHCDTQFILCIERRNLDPRLTYSDEFSVELGHLLLLLDQHHSQGALGYLPSIFGVSATNKLNQFYNQVGCRAYRFDGSIDIRNERISTRSTKYLCKRLHSWL